MTSWRQYYDAPEDPDATESLKEFAHRLDALQKDLDDLHQWFAVEDDKGIFLEKDWSPNNTEEMHDRVRRLCRQWRTFKEMVLSMEIEFRTRLADSYLCRSGHRDKLAKYFPDTVRLLD